MQLTTWHYIGIFIFLLDLIWVVFYYYYATVKIYNFIQGEEYRYLGFLWIRRKQGEWFLMVPKDMIENSLTTKYKLVSQSGFHALRKGESLFVSFENKYEVKVKIEKEFWVTNYISTSNQF